ncbi:MAG: hypothetical protein QOI04_478 [Verrucomicrobiota bacterium]|jgi:hypothetical protein
MQFMFARKITLGLLCSIGILAQVRGAADPAKIVGPESCGNCHKQEFSAWQKTHHFKTFEDLHRRPSAKVIADKMGVQRIKSEGACVQCHYTSQAAGAELKPIAGVSCELCHGASKEWVALHNVKSQQAKAKEKGWIAPDDVYALATNCFQCHTIPNEKLVNTSGHAAGSPIELVSWSQGEVRHHFLSGAKNQPNSPDRLRILYVVGRIVDLEYSLRGVAKSTEKAVYAVNMAKRVVAAKEKVKAILAVVPKDELKDIVATADGVSLKLNNEAAITEAANKISESAKKIASTYKGSDLAAVDPQIPPPSEYKGPVANP